MSSPDQCIIIRGARVHNLKGIDLEIPKGRVVVICGPSGSGKTSLAFDTLFLEGQRRYIESFSPRIRQRLDDLPPSEVDHISGLSPTVAITGRPSSRLRHATVATLAGIHHYLRLVFTHLGHVFCYRCGRPVRKWDSTSIEDFVLSLSEGPLRMMLAFPLELSKEATFASILADLRASGWVRVIVGNRIINLTDLESSLGGIETQLAGGQSQEPDDLDKSNGHPAVYVVADRLTVQDKRVPGRFRETIDRLANEGKDVFALFIHGNESLAFKSTAGIHAVITIIEDEKWIRYDFPFSLRCLTCQIKYEPPHPDLFNFNTAVGACETCQGLGTVDSLEATHIFPDRHLSLKDGAAAPFRSASFSRFHLRLLEFAKRIGIPIDRPVGDLPEEHIHWLLHGSPQDSSSCVERIFRELERYRYKPQIKTFLHRWRVSRTCPDCQGRRLRIQSLAVRLVPKAAMQDSFYNGMTPSSPLDQTEKPPNIAEFCEKSIGNARAFLETVAMPVGLNPGARLAVNAVLRRLHTLEALGLGYLTLSRPADTLSQGEFRRVLLSAALGSSLVNVLYILDEPSLGLHPNDIRRLRDVITSLRDRGNTVVVVEHDEALLKCTDWVVELGPGAGERGGEVVFQGTLEHLQKSETLTGEYLSGRRQIKIDRTRRTPAGWIKLVGATGHNLKHVTAEFPLNVLCVVTGVSGAGKSSLIEETLYPALCQRLFGTSPPSLPFEDLMGERQISDVLLVDQSPISKTTRSNPATILKVFDEIRSLFAQTSEAKTRGLTPGHFSFNAGDGRCGRCLGEGRLEIDMEFLPNMEITCPDCHGRRYRPDVLSVLYRGKSIADVLDMTIREAYFFFRGHATIQSKLRRLMDVGLEYLRLGQATRTLSGGESQRLRLASYFTRSCKKATLFILNEPTTGLHPHDIVQLLRCFESLLAYGHSLIVIEHNVHVMAAADYIIDLGPGPAERGGTIVAQGPPEEIAGTPESITGRYLLDLLPQMG